MKRRRGISVPPGWRRAGALVLWTWLAGFAEGAVAASAHWDARIPSGPQPAWFGPVLSQPALNLHLWRAPLRPPEGSGDLAVTFVFRQVPGGLARVVWQGPGKVVTLCANLFEQAAPWHQRTLLIPRATLGGEGQLTVESTGPTPSLERVELCWVEPRVFSSADVPARLLTPAGRWWPGEELSGEAMLAGADEIHGKFVDAGLEAGPMSLESGQNARLLSWLQGRPGMGRIRAQVSGLQPGEELRIWVNGTPLSSVAVETPRLDDPGYRQAGPDGWIYAGWRQVAAFVPAGWLRPGENQFDWSGPAGGAGLVLRNVRLEISAQENPQILSSDKTPAPTVVRAVSNPASLPSPGSSVPSGARLRLGLSSARSEVGLRPE